jgi:hypothetical protein
MHRSDCTSPPKAEDLCGNAATKTWVPAVAAALDAEFSQVGFGGLGWVVGGGGGVAPFFTPGNPAKSSWDRVWSGAPPRKFAGLDYIFVLHATNDGFRGHKNNRQVTGKITGRFKMMYKGEIVKPLMS